MKSRMIRLRVATDEADKWEAEAIEEKLSLSAWIRKRCETWTVAIETGPAYESIPRGEELAAGEASARSNDASGEIASRRLPKAAKPQKSISVELPDTTLCQHNMFKGACPRCK